MKPGALHAVPGSLTADPKVIRLAAAAPARRETSWRDLVRRLARNPLKPG